MGLSWAKTNPVVITEQRTKKGSNFFMFIQRPPDYEAIGYSETLNNSRLVLATGTVHLLHDARLPGERP
jgi:hypothetical protein